jgi:hypothetical protein
LSVSVERSVVVLALLLGVSLIPACKKQGEMTQPADADSSKYADASSDPLVELERLEGRMRELGVAPPPAKMDEPVGVGETPLEAKLGGEDEDERSEDLADGTTIEGTMIEDPPSPGPAPMAERDDHQGESRCTSVCELSEAICELEVRICSMAKKHGDDSTYVNACERAVDDCELSGDACDTCSE